jgi:hypothetical protein
MGVDFVRRCRPSVVVPVHHDDYTVFRSALSDFVDRAQQHALGSRLRCPRHGEVVGLDPSVQEA